MILVWEENVSGIYIRETGFVLLKNRRGHLPMTELLFDDPCILFALNRESQAFRREFAPQQRFPGAPCWARFCGPAWLTVFVMHGGIGAGRTEKALDWLLSKPVLGNVPYQPKVVLTAGFAGALRENLQVGDVILATEVMNTQGETWPVTWPAALPDEPWQPPLHRGRVLTASKLAGQPEAKRSLGQQFHADAVDMESAVVARKCTQKGVPFGCVRVISDAVQTGLSAKLVSLLSGGSISPLRVALALLTKPTIVGEFWRLARHTRYAGEQLGKALGELLTLTLPWSDELEKR
jgi:nucleoside phosphorylase